MNSLKLQTLGSVPLRAHAMAICNKTTQCVPFAGCMCIANTTGNAWLLVECACMSNVLRGVMRHMQLVQRLPGNTGNTGGTSGWAAAVLDGRWR
jgi:hypothetical protein